MKQKNVKQKQKFFLENTGYVELFNRMPYGSAAKIRERMIKKFGQSHAFSLSYINMVINPEDPRINMDIIQTALEYSSDLYVADEKLKQIIRDMNNDASTQTVPV